MDEMAENVNTFVINRDTKSPVRCIEKLMIARTVPQNYCTSSIIKIELAKGGMGCQKGSEYLVTGRIQEDARGPFGRSV